MNCPYCGMELIEGYLYGAREPLTWLTKEKKTFLGIFPNEAEIVEDSKSGEGVFEKLGLVRPKVTAYKCNSCKKLIINL